MRGLVIGNADDVVGLESGFVGDRLRARGVELFDVARERPEEWPDPEGFELIVSLGSIWNVYRERTARQVAAEGALLRSAHERGQPVLGICFGAQVLAHGLGAAVVRAPRAEIGWVAIERTPAGAATELPDGIDGPWMEWHHDVFAVPAGFVELARTAAAPQLVRAGRSVGTQFHPEVNMAMLESWASGGADEYRAAGGDPDALLAESAERLIRAEPATHALVDWFLDLP